MAGTSTAMAKAGFWIRALALIIDAIAVGIVVGALNAILFAGDGSRGVGLSTLVGIAYYAYCWTAAGGGQTLGMRIFNLKVIRTDGTYLTVGGALVRYLMLIVSFVAFGIGVIWVAFDANKQGWHDKVAGTYVVKTS